MPRLTRHLDPHTLARIDDEGARIRCPACGGTCTREEWAGTSRGRRVQVRCAYCAWRQLYEITADGAVIAVDREPADRRQPGHDPINTLGRSACRVKCGKLATDGGFCETCNRAWRIAGRPEPRDQWAIHHADQLAADRAKTTAAKRAKSKPAKSESTTTPKEEAAMITESSDAPKTTELSTKEKKRWAYVKKIMPDLTLEQWVADDMPKPAHYRKAAKPRVNVPLKHVRRPVESTSAPTPTQPAAKLSPLVSVESKESPNQLMDLANTIISTAAKRGGRCRVMIFDITLDGESDS